MHGFIFIDESGDLGLKGSDYLVLAALLVEDCRPLDRIIKNMRRNKFRKELRNAMEIKANKSSDALRAHMLTKLGEVKNARVLYMVLEKKRILSEYLVNNKHKLYNFVAGKLAKNIPLSESAVEIHIDLSKGKQLLQQDFNEHFIRNLNNPKARVAIFHSYSHSWSGLQFADLLAWACFQKFEHRNSTYIDLVKIEQEVYHVW